MVIYKNNYLFIFGGIMDITKEKNDVFAYDITNNTWKKVSGSTNALTQARSPDGRRKQVNLSNATEEFERK